MPYGLKKETPKQTKKIEEMVAAMVRDGMKEEQAIPIAISQMKKMRKNKTKIKLKKEMTEKLFLAELSSDTLELGEKMFKKQVLRYGKWNYNGSDFVVDENLVDTLISNFQNGVWQNIPVTRGHKENEVLEEHPEYVVSYVKALEKDSNGLNMVFTVDDEESADEVIKKYRDVSAGILDGYEDHETGQNKGSVLTHIALVVEPYIKKLAPFIQLGEKNRAEVIELTNFEESNITKPIMNEEVTPVVTPEVEVKPVEEKPVEPVADETVTVDEAPVEETEVKSEEAQEQPKVEEPKPTEDGKTEEVTLSESAKVQKELADARANEKLLADKLATLEAEKLFSEALNGGKVLPAQRDAAIALLKAGKNTIHFGESSVSIATLFADFLAKAKPVIKFGEDGVTPANTVVKDPVRDHFTEAQWEGLKQMYPADYLVQAEKIAKMEGVDTTKPEPVIVVPSVVETKVEVEPETKVEVRQEEK